MLSNDKGLLAALHQAVALEDFNHI